MRVGILGPVRAWTADGRTLELGTGRPRVLLARLALEPGRVVRTSELVDALWAGEPPTGVTNALQAVVSRLRRAVQTDTAKVAVQTVPVDAAVSKAAQPAGPGRLRVVSYSSGYLLDVRPDDVDAVRFERHVGAGRDALRAGEPAEAYRLLSGALDLWRGPVFADLADVAFATSYTARLDELRLAATEDRHEAALQLDRHADAVAELESLAQLYPLRERITALLIRALAGVGRQAEALAAYERLRRRLADELGIDPSPQLTETHLAALRGELVPSGASASVVDAAAVPGRRPVPVSAAEPEAATGAHGAPDHRGGAGAVSGVEPGDSPGDGADRNTPTPGRFATTGLPPKLTSFIGRDEDVCELTALLSEHRLITLHGPGGAGKTRLAVESVRQLEMAAAPGADGVWFVQLASVGEPAGLAAAVLTAMGGREMVTIGVDGLRDATSEPRAAERRVAEILADKDAVLVLDNCEHLVNTVASMVESLLVTCPGLRVVTTSREPLGMEGERLYTVGPLPVPAPQDCPDLLNAFDYPAVRLFVERAEAVRPDFRFDERTVAPVVEICRRLDGMPLAIELAAARVRALSPAQIAERLDDRFRLLTNGGRTALARHQTLRAVVEWSWELLDEPQRVLLRRLSVFSGGASLDAVEQVCGGAGLEVADVLDTVASLVDKSLVAAMSGENGGEVRYRLLETVKAYAEERLVDSEEAVRVRDAHARYFADLLDRAGPCLHREEQLRWMARLGEEHDNLLTALRWVVQVEAASTAAHMGAVLGYYWLLRGTNREAGPWLREVLDLPDPEPPVQRALVHVYEAISCDTGGERAMLYGLARARAVCRRVPAASDSPVHALVEALWAGIVDGRPEARVQLEPARTSADAWTRGMGFLVGSFLARAGSDVVTRDRDLLSALAEFRSVGDRMGQGVALRLKSAHLRENGDVADAAEVLEEALRLNRELGTAEDGPVLMAELAMLKADLGDYGPARTLLDTAMWEARCYGSVEALIAAKAGQGWLSYREGDVAAAMRSFADASASMREAYPQGWAWVLTAHAYVAVAAGDVRAGAELVAQALRATLGSAVARGRSGVPDLYDVAYVTQAGAAVAAAGGEPARAARLLGIATRLRGVTDAGSRERAWTEAAARKALGDAAVDAAYADGAGLDVETALDELGHLANEA